MMKLRGNKKGVSPAITIFLIVIIAASIAFIIAFRVANYFIPAFTVVESDPVVVVVNSKTFFLGKEIYAITNHKFLFHGFKDGYLVIAHIEHPPQRADLVTVSNIFVDRHESEFRLLDRTFRVVGLDTSIPSISLEWID